jgi:hypothetical protein
MSVTKDVKTIGLVLLLVLCAAVFASTFQDQLKKFFTSLSNSLTGGANGIGGQAAAIGQSAGAAVTNAGTGIIDGIGNTFGDWLWKGFSTVFPSLSANGADSSELNADPMAGYDAKQAGAWANNPDSTSIANYVPSGFPNVPVDPSDW